MGFYHNNYNGLDKETRIDCLAQIRREQNPPGHSPLDVDALSKSNRSTKEDAKKAGGTREPGKLVKIGSIEF